jgi:hypothetical protein
MSSAPSMEGSIPLDRAQLRSHADMQRGFRWDASVDGIERLPAQQIPSYARPVSHCAGW